MSATAGNKTNPSFTSTFDNAPDPASNAATLIVTALTDPTTTKTFVTSPILPGGTTVMRITITNTNAGTAITSVALTDTYPVGLFNTATPTPTITATGGSSCTLGTVTAPANGNTLTLSGLTIGTAGTRTCQIDVNVTAPANGAYVNSTGVVNSANAPQGVAASATLNVMAPPTITKSFSPSSIAGGGSSVLTIIIGNPGSNPINMTGVSFTDVFPTTPGAMTLTNATTTNTCTAGGTAGTLRDSAGNGIGAGDVGIRIQPAAGATIPPGGTCTITANVTAAVAGNYSNTTTAVTSTNAGTGTTANATLSVARLGIAKAFSPASINNGGTSTITFTISNPTGGAVAGLAFTDAFPTGMSMSSATVGGTCTGVASNAGIGVTNFAVTAGAVPVAGCTVTITITSTSSGTSDNQSSGASYTGFPTPGAPSNIATLIVAAPPTVSKSFAPVAVAQNATSLLTITLTNSNSTAITGAGFTDTYPAGLVNTATPAGSSTCPSAVVTAAAAGNTLVVSGATLPANSSCIVTVNVSAAAAGSYTNTFPAGGLTTSGGTNAAAAAATLSVLSVPTVAKSFSPTGVAVGQSSTMTITLTNPNSTVITGAAFTDTYPANLRNATVPNAASNCPAGTVSASPTATNPGTLTFSAGSIPANGSCTVTVDVVSSVSANYTNNTGAVTTTNAGSGASASAILSVGVPSIAKVFSPNPVQLGQSSVLNFTVTNGTPTAMTGVTFSDTLPTTPGAMTVASPVSTSNTCGGTFAPISGAGSVTLTGGSIPANSSCTVTVAVATAAIGSYTNTTGAVSATGPLTGNTATAGLVVNAATPSLNKAFGGALTVGGTQTLTFTVTQPSGNTTQAFNFTDTLPAGLVLATPSVVTGTCAGGSVTATAGSNTITVTGRTITNVQTSCTISVTITTSASPVSGSCPQAANTNGNAQISAFSNITRAIADAAYGGGAAGAAGSGACITVNTPTNLTLAKTNSSATVDAGATTTYTLTVTNTGNVASSGTITVVDVLPAGMTIAAGAVTLGGAQAANWTCTAAGQNITCTSGTAIAGAGTSIFSFSPTVSAATTGTLTNKAQIGGGGDPTNPSAPTAATAGACTGTDAPTEGCAIDGPDTVNAANISLAKSNGVATVNAGGTTTYTLTVSNSGNVRLRYDHYCRCASSRHDYHSGCGHIGWRTSGQLDMYGSRSEHHLYECDGHCCCRHISLQLRAEHQCRHDRNADQPRASGRWR